MAYVYRSTILADAPLIYCRDSTGVDASGNERNVSFSGGAGATAGASLVTNDANASIALAGAGYGTGASDAVMTPAHVTIEAIAQLANTTSVQRIASKWTGSSGWILALVSGNWRWIVSTAGGQDFIESSVPAAASRQHIIASYDGTNLVIRVNGSIDTKAHAFGGDATSNMDPLNIGSQEGGGGQYLDGLIDELSIYDTALSDSRAAIHYAAAALDIPLVKASPVVTTAA